MNVDFKAIKTDYKFLPPIAGKWFNFSLKYRKKQCFLHKTSFCEKTVSLTCWADLMCVGALFSSLDYECGLRGNQI